MLIEGIESEQEALDGYIKKHDLQKDVLLLGSQPNVFDLMNAADFTILSSIEQEDFPNVVLESMALGKAVIGSRIAGIPELTDEEKTGLLVSAKSVKQGAVGKYLELYQHMLCNEKEE